MFRKAEELLTTQANARDDKRLEKVQNEKA